MMSPRLDGRKPTPASSVASTEGTVSFCENCEACANGAKQCVLPDDAERSTSAGE